MRYFSSTAVPTTLQAGIDNSATTMRVASSSGYPAQTPFTVVIDPNTALEEVVTVTAAVGTQWTVLRAQDGTSALPHSTGAAVRHMATARDFREAQEHIEASTGVHGLTSGSVVGTSQAQTLTNKVIDGNSNTVQNISRSSVTGLNGQLSSLGNQITSLDGRVDALEGYSPPLMVKVANGTAGAPSSDNEVQGVGYEYEQVEGTWAVSGGNTNQFRIPETGFYQISAQMAYALPDNTTGPISFRLRTGVQAGDQDSGTVAKNATVSLDNQGGQGQLTITTLRRLIAGTNCHFSVINGTNKTITVTGSPTRTYFSLVRVA